MSEVSQKPVGGTRRFSRVVWKFVLIPLMILYCITSYVARYEIRNMKEPLYPEAKWDGDKYSSSNNPYRHYETAIRLISDEDMVLLDKVTDSFSKGGNIADIASEEQIDKALADIQPAIAQLRAGAACSQKSYVFAYKEKSMNTRLPEFAPLRKFARFVVLDATKKIQSGKTDEGIDEILSVAEMGSGMKRSGPLIAGLVGYGIDSIAFASLSQVMGSGTLTASQYRRVSNGLERSGLDSPKFEDIMKEEYLLNRSEMVRVLSTDPGKLREEMGIDPDSSWFQPLLFSLYINIPGNRTRTINNFDRAWKANFESYELPYTKSNEPDMEKLIPRTDLLNRVFFPVFSKARTKDVQDFVIRRGIRLEAVLEAYRLEHGQYPERLDQLAGSYMSQIPSDPFAEGEPFKYSRKGNKYLLYSIGMDFTDDGGKIVRPFSKINEEKHGDIVFSPGLDIWKN